MWFFCEKVFFGKIVFLFCFFFLTNRSGRTVYRNILKIPLKMQYHIHIQLTDASGNSVNEEGVPKFVSSQK